MPNGDEAITAVQDYWAGVMNYMNEFMSPYWAAANSFYTIENEKIIRSPLEKMLKDYTALFQLNLRYTEKAIKSTLLAMNEYHARKSAEAFSAWVNTVFNREGEDIISFVARQARLLKKVVHDYPDAIARIKSQYGFHFETDGYFKITETDRFLLYQVLPTDKNIAVRKNGKPILIFPPYVLGANILAFLPEEKKSYVHSFANMGIPTYIRVMKDIRITPLVQVMTGEDDAEDARYFCEQIMSRHGKPVTLNGYCQGGFIAMADLLSGELDGLADALITCVAPMDGTRSKSLVEYLNLIPPRFRDIGYAIKTLPNGNQVVDGSIMSWVFKLKSIDRDAPLVTFYRDLTMFDRPGGKDVIISNTAAALHHWLVFDRTDLPIAITKMSFDSYTIPVDKEGNLPIKLFGRTLNFKRLTEKKIPFLICYAEMDDLVDKEAVLAPIDFIDAEITAFPKGHVSIATSWSHPASACSLHIRFGKNNYRGPVRFQLDLEEKK